jgi:glycosyltransferase involved in cell wall biosynthesis
MYYLDIFVGMQEKSFVIVIASYKNAPWYRQNIQSVLNQRYSNYRVIYTDDCSPDNTGGLIEQFLQQNDPEKRVTLIKNQERKGAIYNLYHMIHSCNDDDIIITVDGDDWLTNPDVLSTLNQVYSNEDVWMTYGQYRSYPDNRIGCSRQIPPEVVNSSGYRKYHWCSSHLRTFYAWLFKKIKQEDFFHNGTWIPMTWDLAMMFPMLEMAGTRHKFVSDVLYIYNCENPINDSKVNLQLQQGLEMFFRFQKPQYPRLNNRE